MRVFDQGEIIEAVINDQWCDAKITKVIPPTQEEIEQDKQDEDEVYIYSLLYIQYSFKFFVRLNITYLKNVSRTVFDACAFQWGQIKTRELSIYL